MSFARTNFHVFSRNTATPILILLLLISLCIPVTGLVINGSTGTTTAETGILNASYYENQGKALMAEQDWAGVIDNSNEGLGVYPYNPELLCLQAYALRKTGHYQESVDLVSLAIPNDTRPVRYANRGYGLPCNGEDRGCNTRCRLCHCTEFFVCNGVCPESLCPPDDREPLRCREGY